MPPKHLMELTIFQKNLLPYGRIHWQRWISEICREWCRICLFGSCAALAGCAHFPFQSRPPESATHQTQPPPALVSPTALTEQAALILMRAEHSVDEARKTRSVWTTAAEKLALARQAAAGFNSENTIALSQEVIALCARSAAQAKLPPVSW